MCGHPGDDGKGRGLMQAHLVPHSEGGDDNANNIVLLCRTCHAKYDAGQRHRSHP
ncbi:HNH endonuclease [Acidiferrimicrobium sp. IK]|uniref:HNH endonuclease n=1 Tax=Acidiferrimicrobium sp. IK TaxID=2871700 RepID=UPI003966B445